MTAITRDDLDAQAQRAQAAEKRTDWLGAIECWQTIISIDPLSVLAWIGFGRASLRAAKLKDGLIGFRIAAQYGKSDRSQAREVANAAAQLGLWTIVADVLSKTDPDDVSLSLVRGEALLRAGSPSRVKDLARRLLDKDGEFLPALMLLAHAERRAGKVQLAESILRTLLLKYPADSSLRASIAENLVDRGIHDEAQRLLDEAPANAHRNAMLVSLRGRLAEQHKDFAKAAEFYREALAIDPNHIETHLWFGRLSLQHLAAPNEAAILVRHLLAIAPIHGAGTVLFSDVSEVMGFVPEAIDRLNEFHGAFPTDTRVGLRLIKHLTTLGEGLAATAIASEFIRNPSRSKAFALDLATALASVGNWNRAVAELFDGYQHADLNELVRVLTRAFEVLPDAAAETMVPNVVMARWRNPDLAVRMIQRYRDSAKIERALSWAEALVRSSPDDISGPLMVTLADLARLGGRPQLAGNWIAKARESAPAAASQYDALRAIERKDLVQAKTLLLKSIKANAEDIQSWMRMVGVLVQAGQFAEAEEIIDNAMRNLPTSTDLVRAKFEVALLLDDEPRAITIAEQLGPIAPDRLPSQADVLSISIGEALRRGDLNSATGLIRSLVNTTGKLIESPARHRIVFDYIQLISKFGEGAAVEALARRAIEQGYSRTRTLDLLSDHLLAQGDVNRALAVTEEALQASGDSFERRRRHAQLLLKSQRWSDAVDATFGLIRERPAMIALMQLRSQALAGCGKIDDAEAVLRLAVHHSRSRIDIVQEFVAFLRKNQRLEHEIASLREHVELFKGDVTAKLRLAICQFQNGELGDADRTLISLVSTHRYDVAVLELHVMIRHLRMDHAGAQDLIAMLDVQRLSTPSATRRVSALYKQVFDYSSSARPLRRVANAGVIDISVMLALLEYMTDWDDPQEALDAADRLLSYYPLEPRGYFLKGLLLHQMGEIDAARIAMQSVLFLRRSDPVAMMHLGLVEEELGNPASALTWYNSSIDASTGSGRSPSARTLWHRFLVLMITGQPAQAVEAHKSQCELYDDVFPSHLRTWQGEPLHGSSLFVAMRGGPGDELRIASMCFQSVLDSGVTRCTFACDPRLYTVLTRSYPKIKFVPTFSGIRQLRRTEGGALQGSARPTLERAWPGVTTRVVEMLIPFDQLGGHDFVCHSDRFFHEVYVENAIRKGQEVKHRFLVPDARRRGEMRAFLAGLGSAPKIGLCWRGSFINRYRRRGYFSIEEISSILALQGVEFIDLQVNKTVDEAAALRAAGVHSVPGLDLYDDFEGVTALISELDLVLTPGVTVRDIAGALNVPTWSFTVIPGASDVWRKTDNRRDSWFPSITHYDLLSFASREGVVAAVASDLKCLPGSMMRRRFDGHDQAAG